MISKLIRIAPILFFIIIGVLIVSLSKNLDVETAKNLGGVLGPAAYPMLLGVMILALSFLYIIRNWSSKREQPKEQASSQQLQSNYVSAIIGFIGLLILTYFLEVLGFIVISILLMFMFNFLMGERRWSFLIAGSVLFPLIVYAIFRYGFNIVLPEGILTAL